MSDLIEDVGWLRDAIGRYDLELRLGDAHERLDRIEKALTPVDDGEVRDALEYLCEYRGDDIEGVKTLIERLVREKAESDRIRDALVKKEVRQTQTIKAMSIEITELESERLDLQKERLDLLRDLSIAIDRVEELEDKIERIQGGFHIVCKSMSHFQIDVFGEKEADDE